jgi:SNF2 family DNA or RNA helicase
MNQKIFMSVEPRLDAKINAYEYQSEAVDKIKELEYSAIFHEQGLGKSKIAIDLILYWLDKKSIDTVLLVAKKGLVHNWIRELKLHTHIKPNIISNNSKENFYVFNSPSRLILSHFEAISVEQKRLEVFLKTRNVAIVMDESTKIKNPLSSITKVFFNLAPLFKKRIILTGTPVANRPFDIWAQIHFLDNGNSLGKNFDEFKKNLDLNNKFYKDDSGKEKFEEALSSLYSKISKFTVRENKDSKYVHLPKKIYKNIVTDWEPSQLALYEEYINNLRGLITKNGVMVEDEAEDIIKRLLRLVQISSNPKLVDESYSQGPGKLKYLIDLVEAIVKKNEKVIIWTMFTENIEFIAKNLDHKSVKIYGKMNMDDRNISVERFLNDDDIKILIATPGAAKEGLTLTVANHAIFYDRGFSLDDYLQSQDRIHRVSQTKECYIYILQMKDSIDQWVDLLISAKSFSARLAQGDISIEEFRKNIKYSFGQVLKQILKLEI